MRKILSVSLLFFLASCGITKHVVKDKETADSTIHRYAVEVQKKDVDLSLQQKVIIKTKDTAVSNADSLHSSFSYDPKRKDTIRIQVGSGKLKGTLLLHPDLGTGDFLIFKNAEQIPVDSYREENTSATYHSTDTTAKARGVDKAVHTDGQHIDRTVKSNVVTGLLIFLFFFFLLLFFLWRWVKKRSITETVTNILDR